MICKPENEEVDCTTCKLCASLCPSELNLPDAVRFYRYLNDSKGSHRDLFLLISSLQTNLEPTSWLKTDDLKIKEENEIVYFIESDSIFDILLERDSNYANVNYAGIKVLNHLGIEPQLIYGCCGHDLYYAGRLDEFEDLKTSLIEKLKGKKIIVGGAECYHMFKEIYKLDVKHFSEFIEKKGIQLKKLDVKTTWHDPCRLGRYSNIYDAPRKLLNEISDFTEIEHNKEESLCCGISSWFNCNIESKKLRIDRINEAIETGAEYLVTSCNKCRIHFDCLYFEEDYKDYPKKIKIVDLQEIVAHSLGLYDIETEERFFEIKEIEGKLPNIQNIEMDIKRYLNEDIINNIFKCTTCGVCTVKCPSGYHSDKMFEDFRKYFVKEKINPIPHQKINENIKNFGNPFGEKEIIGNEKKDAEIIYFPGCTAKYRMTSLMDATIEILDNLGIKYEIPKESVCCGSVLLRTGYDPSELIKKNKEIFKDKLVIVSCSGCYSTFAHDYPEVNVKHISEFLLDKLDKLNLNEINAKVVYHDPCHLGRSSGIYDEPRKVIATIPGTELKEFNENKEYSQCCGGGGGVRAGMPDLANEIAKNKDKAAKELEVDVILSACPFCKLNISQNTDIQTLDIVEYLLKSLRGEKL